MKKLISLVCLLSSIVAGHAGGMSSRARQSRPVEAGGGVVRILAIGNSFSEDAVDQYFHEICAAAGKKVVVGDLYIPGCPLERHHLNALADSAAYRFRRIGLDGATITASPVKLGTALASDEWDFVSFQQSSPLSGLYSSYVTLRPHCLHTPSAD